MQETLLVLSSFSSPRNPELHGRSSWRKLLFNCLLSSHCSVRGLEASCLPVFRAPKAELFHPEPCPQWKRKTKHVRLIPPRYNLFHLCAE